ncbi:5-methyltetrahydrofolate--homocysteine methyltransferase [Clostridium algifaecis]|uniref:Methionine synthase n=1 Tax=Clostridium algifaecis TaxID=1472040 RepID=A0ABS4KQG5_9CLOT|nr:homocysteine S-methyltransferase family protein [Clostridium algifaecis]MBP2032280.1 5-methyltetrahydrofolate--homocysteine methyltransferase [Clostridium algifaecis]
MTLDNLLEKFKNKFIFFDGAMGTMLQKCGLKPGELPEILNITNSDTIKKIHETYLDAGSDIVITNTFGANDLKYSDSEYSSDEVIEAGVKIAKQAVAGRKNKFVALDIGPIGQVMEPSGNLTFDGAYNLFKKQVVTGERAGADLILIETMMDLYETKAAVLAARENSSLPVFCTMTFQENGRTLMGTDPKTMVIALEGLGVDALGVNCSLGPSDLQCIVDEILEYSSIPVMVQPNAGLPKYDGKDTYYDVDVEEFSNNMRIMAKKGVRILGGCCGTNPDFIKGVVKAVEDLQPLSVQEKNYTAVTSSTQTVTIGKNVKIVGERINPTGKALYKQELREKSVKYIENQAVIQKEEGADILELNVGLPEINEVEMMKKAIKAIQKVSHLPVSIDSPDAKVLETGARLYNGKPLINSVNGKEKTMQEVFPIVKKYGGCVIALTLDENGIPKTAEERFKIAENIVKKASEYGINKKNIVVDCLSLTASAQQKEVMETIKAIKMVTERLGVNATLGVSNVSFGLPNRKLLNRTFLLMALQAGLKLPIMNPHDGGMKDTIAAFEVLANVDKDSKTFIEKYKNMPKEVNQISVSINRSEIKNTDNKVKCESSDSKDLKQVIIDGIEDKTIEYTNQLLKTNEPLDIVNNYIIPALDKVGVMYEEKEIFLPQLIQSAETVKKSFEVIKKKIDENGDKGVEKGKIVLATVKGDVHDIGKNIVKVLLENYGFDVIDLGKDVDIEEVVETVKKHKIKVVGLSALMTTTVISMKRTIEALRKNDLPCSVIVGGAVLNEEYASMIGADFYAKDARDTVKIAEKIFSEDKISSLK